MVSLISWHSLVNLIVSLKSYKKNSFIQSLLKNQIYWKAGNDQMECNCQKQWFYVFGMEKSSVGYGIHKTNSISLSHTCNIVNASNSNKQCTTPFFLNK